MTLPTSPEESAELDAIVWACELLTRAGFPTFQQRHVRALFEQRGSKPTRGEREIIGQLSLPPEPSLPRGRKASEILKAQEARLASLRGRAQRLAGARRLPKHPSTFNRRFETLVATKRLTATPLREKGRQDEYWKEYRLSPLGRVLELVNDEVTESSVRVLQGNATHGELAILTGYPTSEVDADVLDLFGEVSRLQGALLARMWRFNPMGGGGTLALCTIAPFGPESALPYLTADDIKRFDGQVKTVLSRVGKQLAQLDRLAAKVEVTAWKRAQRPPKAKRGGRASS